ncbi:MAG: lipoyl synthase [Chlamydiales bacterium]|nr:lipoyl synthase [Chlamydiales bacterium]
MSEQLFDVRPTAQAKRLNKLPENPENANKGRFPSWLHRKLPRGGNLFKTNEIVDKYNLNTVCEEAKCPNRLECYSKKTATFLALGKECTRACGFCDIDFAKQPKPLEADEPLRIAKSAKELGLKHVVITMVARDDLPDQGAAQIAAILEAIRQENPGCTTEVLTSDFNGKMESLDIILDVNPEVFNHNIETVRALTPKVRHVATYDRTLSVLRHAKASGKSRFVKSGLMLGLGETKEQVHETLHDLKEAGCDIVTIGQYLQADRGKLVVKSFVTPEEFAAYRDYGQSIGIKNVYSGPFVRSSYNANLLLEGTPE